MARVWCEDNLFYRLVCSFLLFLRQDLHPWGGRPAGFQVVLPGSQMHTDGRVQLSLCRFWGPKSGYQAYEPSDFPQRATLPALRKAFVVGLEVVGKGWWVMGVRGQKGGQGQRLEGQGFILGGCVVLGTTVPPSVQM